MNYQGRIYYALGNSKPVVDPNSSHLQFAIQYIPAPGTGPQDAPVRVAIGSTLPNTPSSSGHIVKMSVVNRENVDNTGLSPSGVCLTSDGTLLVFFLDYVADLFLETRVLATDVSDFVVRRERYYRTGGAALPYEQDSLYITQGRNSCVGNNHSTVSRIDPLLGGATVVWTAPTGLTIQSLGADADYLFVSSLSCQPNDPGVIRSKYLPAFPPPPVRPASRGRQLESDHADQRRQST